MGKYKFLLVLWIPVLCLQATLVGLLFYYFLEPELTHAGDESPPPERTHSVVPLRPLKPFAFFTLIRGGKGPYSSYQKRCEALRPHRNNNEDIAFHEGNVPEAMVKSYADEYDVRFVNVGVEFTHTNAADAWRKYWPSSLKRPPATWTYSEGYKHMCRFFAMRWYLYLAKYDVVVRLDEDVTIIAMDEPFVWMQQGGYEYAYSVNIPEAHQETVLTMEAWLRSQNVSNPDVSMIFFTNVFASRPKWWLQNEDARAWLERIERSENIYVHRWGDAPIQSFLIRTLLPNKSLAQMRVEYNHGSTYDVINSFSTTKQHMGLKKSIKERSCAYYMELNMLCVFALNLGLKTNSYEKARDYMITKLMMRAGLSYDVAAVYGNMDLMREVDEDMFERMHATYSNDCSNLKRFRCRKNRPSKWTDTKRVKPKSWS